MFVACNYYQSFPVKQNNVAPQDPQGTTTVEQEQALFCRALPKVDLLSTQVTFPTGSSPVFAQLPIHADVYTTPTLSYLAEKPKIDMKLPQKPYYSGLEPLSVYETRSALAE